jgi:hypothetical protein
LALTRLFLGHLNEVAVIEGIGLLAERLVEAPFVLANLVTSKNQDGPLLGVEGKERLMSSAPWSDTLRRVQRTAR